MAPVVRLTENQLQLLTDRCVGARSCVAQRRLRILTVQSQPARSVLEVHRAADSAAVVTMLTHQLVEVAAAQGAQHAALTLRAWLMRLVAVHAAAQQPGTLPASPEQVWAFRQGLHARKSCGVPGS